MDSSKLYYYDNIREKYIKIFIFAAPNKIQ